MDHEREQHVRLMGIDSCTVLGRASELTGPGGFRRDHIITSLGDTDVVPAYAQAPFLDNIEPHHLIKPKSLLASTYDDFIFANLDYGITQEDYDDVRCHACMVL